MTDDTTSQINETLKGIYGVLNDIADILAEIAHNGERVEISGADLAGSVYPGGLLSDGGFTVPKGEVRTFSDPTILSGDEEGLK